MVKLIIGIEVPVKVIDVEREVTRYDVKTGNAFIKKAKGVEVQLTWNGTTSFCCDPNEVYEPREGQFEFSHFFEDWKKKQVYQSIAIFFDILKIPFNDDCVGKDQLQLQLFLTNSTPLLFVGVPVPMQDNGIQHTLEFEITSLFSFCKRKFPNQEVKLYCIEE